MSKDNVIDLHEDADIIEFPDIEGEITYEVIGINQVDGNDPGTTFTKPTDWPPAEALIAGGHIKAV